MAFDGLEPVDRELASAIFGEVEGVPVGARRVVAAVCGARAGKSYVLVALRLVWGLLVRDLSSMAPGQRAVAMIVAPNEKLRREVLNYALGAIRSKPSLASMLVRELADMFELRRPDGKSVYFEGGVATAGGYGAVGRAYTDFAMDECAFFRDATFKVNDQAIFRAGATRVLPGGQVIVASTPWAKAGLLYELYRDNFGKPDTAVVAHAKTLTMNASATVRAIVEAETKRDPENARREYDAEFMVSGGSVFFDESLLEAAVTDESFTLRPGDEVRAGADLGFTSDSSALVMAARRGDVVHIFDGLECRPTESEPLSLEDTFAKFQTILTRHRCGYVMADHHFRQAMYEALGKHDIAVAPAEDAPADRYVRARVLLRGSRVRIHRLECHDRLMRQLRDVQGKPTTGGGMSVSHPRWATGGHGDIADAMVLALWQLGGDTVPKPDPIVGSPEHESVLQDQRRQALLTEREYEQTDWRSRMGLKRRP